MPTPLAKKPARTATAVAEALEKQQIRLAALCEENPDNQALEDAFEALSQAIAMLDNAITGEDDR